MLITPDDFSSAGGQAGDFLKGLGGAIIGSTCQLYQNFPRSFIGGLTGDSPVGNFNKGVWDSICGGMPNPTLPPPPSRPFSGGQCCSSSYRVTMTATVSPSFGGGDVTGNTSRNNAKVLRGYLSADGSQALVEFENCVGDKFTQVAIQSASGALLSASVQSVVAYSGPDNCGSLPADYPDVTPPPGGGTYNYQPPQGGAPVPVNYDIDILPDAKGPTINFPDLPNLCASFSLFGVEIDLCTNKPGEGGSGDLGDLLDKINDLQNSIDGPDGLRKRVDDLNKEGDGIGVSADEGGDGTDKDVPNLLGVFIEVTALPIGLGREFGTPDKFSFGRISFKRDGFYSEPLPITFLTNYFPAPEGTNGYALTYRAGVVANVQVLKREE